MNKLMCHKIHKHDDLIQDHSNEDDSLLTIISKLLGD